VPAWYALASALLLAQNERTLRAVVDRPGSFAALAAVFFLGGIAGPLVVPFASALPLTLGFYALQGKETRKRLRQALVCPYCRDEVEPEGTVICARGGCGALYHRECWDECSQQYGGCAVYGCSSKKCREVSAAGWFLRMARLAVAAVLFPPKIARAIRQADGEGFAAIYRKAVARARVVGVSTNDDENSPAKMNAHLAFAILLLVVVGTVLVSGVNPAWTRKADTVAGRLTLLAAFIVVPVTLPWVVALPLTLGFYTLRAVATAFKSELAALARADEGGGSVLGRLRAGFGQKS
jgi:hypothetical protein